MNAPITARASMLESLRKCLGCGHLRSSHPGGQCCAAITSDDGYAQRCTCTAYAPGELSSEGRRMEAGR